MCLVIANKHKILLSEFLGGTVADIRGQEERVQILTFKKTNVIASC